MCCDMPAANQNVADQEQDSGQGVERGIHGGKHRVVDHSRSRISIPQSNGRYVMDPRKSARARSSVRLNANDTASHSSPTLPATAPIAYAGPLICRKYGVRLSGTNTRENNTAWR